MLNILYTQEKSKLLRNNVKTQFLQYFKITESALETSKFDVSNIDDLYLEKLYEIYDKVFFKGLLSELYGKTGFSKLNFRFSNKMSNSAGLTIIPREIIVNNKPTNIEIAISRKHLYYVNISEKDIEIGGIEVKTPLEALLLVFEHELCHLIEFLLFKKTSCNGKTFKTLVFNYFGHKKSTHQLPSAKEINLSQYDFRPGDKIIFTYKGEEKNGIIVKINKNAIVMASDINGGYVDKQNNRFSKFYVPLKYINK